MFLAILFWFNLLVSNQDISNLRSYYDLIPIRVSVKKQSDYESGIYYDGIAYIDNLGLSKYTVIYKD